MIKFHELFDLQRELEQSKISFVRQKNNLLLDNKGNFGEIESKIGLLELFRTLRHTSKLLEMPYFENL